MSLENLKNKLPEFAKDTKFNLMNVFTEEGASGLSQKQIFQVGLGVSYALKNPLLIESILAEANSYLGVSDIEAAKSAATIMAMNNIYYRFTHLVSDKIFSTMPAKLRMNVIGNPGIDKVDFELICIAISAVNGCGMCVDAHYNELTKAGMSKIAIQSAIRIAAVLNSVDTGIN